MKDTDDTGNKVSFEFVERRAKALEVESQHGELDDFLAASEKTMPEILTHLNEATQRIATLSENAHTGVMGLRRYLDHEDPTVGKTAEEMLITIRNDIDQALALYTPPEAEV